MHTYDLYEYQGQTAYSIFSHSHVLSVAQQRVLDVTQLKPILYSSDKCQAMILWTPSLLAYERLKIDIW